jgi:hypothetical protein
MPLPSLGKGENFLASDVSAIVRHTRDAIYLNDYDLGTIGPDDFDVFSFNVKTPRSAPTFPPRPVRSGLRRGRRGAPRIVAAHHERARRALCLRSSP